jgi:hypothetical protein
MANFNVDFNNLFTEDTYNKAIKYSQDGGPYSIKITPSMGRVISNQKDVGITGILKNNISINVDSNWESMGDIISDIAGNNSIINAFKSVGNFSTRPAGISIANAGLVTKKIYKGGGGYLIINPEFRLFDWESTGCVLQQLLTLITLCLPRSAASMTIEEVVKKITAAVPNNKVSKLIDWVTDYINTAVENSGDELLIGSLNVIKHVLDEVGEGDIRLTESPSPVRVQISNWFRHDDMVIESIKLDISDKMTINGPLYIDVSMSLSSREAMVVTDSDTGIEKLQLQSFQNRVE